MVHNARPWPVYRLVVYRVLSLSVLLSNQTRLTSERSSSVCQCVRCSTFFISLNHRLVLNLEENHFRISHILNVQHSFSFNSPSWSSSISQIVVDWKSNQIDLLLCFQSLHSFFLIFAQILESMLSSLLRRPSVSLR